MFRVRTPDGSVIEIPTVIEHEGPEAIAQYCAALPTERERLIADPLCPPASVSPPAPTALPPEDDDEE